MTEFNANQERALLSLLVNRYEAHVIRDSVSMLVASSKLYEDVTTEWCKLTPSEQNATASASSTDSKIVRDGHENPTGILSRDALSFIRFVDCHQK